MRKLTREQFIEKAKLIHGDKYDYSKVIYLTSESYIDIICSKHGVFKQTPHAHIHVKNGCPECGGTKNLNTKEFIKKSSLIHKNRYDYSLVEYINMETKVEITCPEHGIFNQTPSAHLLQKQKCPKCVGNILSSKEEFVNKAIKIHGDKYDYSLVEYKTNKINIKIICPEHGIFDQRPDAHTVKKCGCPSCKISKGESKIRKILIENNTNFEQQKTFDGCKYINVLPFDFYLPRYNMCIEYDGIQHYEPVEVFGGIKAFDGIKKRDEIKTKFCEDNNIKLIRISYRDSIKKYLEKML